MPSRRGEQPGDTDRDITGDIEAILDAEMSHVLGSFSPILQACQSASLESRGRILEEGYSDDSEKIATYLTTLKRPDNMTPEEYRVFRERARRYHVQGRLLYRHS